MWDSDEFVWEVGTEEPLLYNLSTFKHTVSNERAEGTGQKLDEILCGFLTIRRPADSLA